ncbi:Metalloprotease MmpA [Pseudovibrio axinellae]|uniref:Zinc metalloprotease n=1 Tax=Pseudovibrio axinellae TaxID=989403 RepID=A0A166B4R8_9HYPH|nr:RIP metalloprotease RseP [Pseudovibrio axinellae]KZL21884.1 Metalloprotease MmpA [Pseudovibrio axinellae]SEQ82278.1 regulator of sigma E protease [Pseudovibrio axinellae]
MDVLSSVLGGSLGVIIPFLAVLTVVVFFHELGHFLVARWCGVKVLAFSVGFGPELLGRNDKHGTRWKVCAIPLGGYVKFSGDENAASLPDRDGQSQMDEDTRKSAFFAKNPWQRSAVVAAGPIANFILAIVIFAGMFAFLGKYETLPRVDQVSPDSAAQVAGLQPGDLIVAIDGTPVESFNDVQRIVTASAGIPIEIDVERGNAIERLTATPELKEISDGFGNTQKVGILGIQRNTSEQDIIVKRFGPVEALGEGVKETWYILDRTLGYIGGLFLGKEDPDQLGGPIRVAQISGQVATHGILPLINLTAVLSISIGLLNLMPVPMLDGGHLLYYIIEIVRGKPLSEKLQDFGFRIGITLVLLLMVFATWNDLRSIIGS